jgi:hypothetical protein
MINQQRREEFEHLGKREVLKRIDAALYDSEKQKQAYEWLDEQENGAERAYKAKVFRIQTINTCISVLALIVAVIAILKK